MEERNGIEIQVDDVVEEKVISLRELNVEKNRKPTAKQEMLSWIKTIVGTFLVVLLIQQFVFMAVEVHGSSMAPTFSDRQRVIVWKIFYSPKPFDVIVLEHTDGNHHIKRVVGTPGDRVDYIDGELIVNDVVMNESYIMAEPSMNDFTLEEVCQLGSSQFDDCSVIPEEYFLVLGDNRNRSGDSREYGLVHQSQVTGRVVLRFWPFNEFTIAPN